MDGEQWFPTDVEEDDDEGDVVVEEADETDEVSSSMASVVVGSMQLLFCRLIGFSRAVLMQDVR